MRVVRQSNTLACFVLLSFYSVGKGIFEIKRGLSSMKQQIMELVLM